MKTFFYENIDSTNNECKRLIEKKNLPPFIVTTDNQTSGRGQYDRKWWSSKDSLVFSICAPLQKQTKNIQVVSIIAAISICKIIEFFYKDITVGIKWPNDVLLIDPVQNATPNLRGLTPKLPKLAGVLIELIQSKNITVCIIGIGINLNNKRDQFPIELQDCMKSLYEASKIILDKKVFLEKLYAIIVENIRLYFDENNYNIQDLFSEYDVAKGKTITFENGITGFGRGINEKGGITVETSAGYKILYTARIIKIIN